MVSPVSNTSSSLVNLTTANQPPKPAPSDVASQAPETVANKKKEAEAAEKPAQKDEPEGTKVTITQQQPQPNTADRNAKPVDAYKAVSAIRS